MEYETRVYDLMGTWTTDILHTSHGNLFFFAFQLSADTSHTQCETISQQPRGVRQVKDARYTKKKTNEDPYKSLLMMMQGDQGQHFIRSIQHTHDNLTVCLFTDHQIDLMEQYCTNTGDKYSPVHVDTTFKLTNMYALIFTIRAVDCEGDPILLGPVLLTQRRREVHYRVLADEIIKHRPSLKHLPLLFITDGEDAIINSLSTFEGRTMFRCINHLKDNIKDQCYKFSINKEIENMIIKDIDILLLEHTDCFKVLAEKTYQKWLTAADATGCSKKMKMFIQYHRAHIEDVVAKNNIRHLSVCGFHKPFDNNVSESLNAKLKNFLQKTSLAVHVLVDELQQFTMHQSEELKKMENNLSQQYINRYRSLPKSNEEGNDDNLLQSLLEDLHVPSTILAKLHREAKQCCVIANTDGSRYFSKMADTDEVLIEVKQADVLCKCETAKRLTLCQHIISVLLLKDENMWRKYVAKKKKSKEPTMTTLVGRESGQKPGARRKGGRTVESRALESEDFIIIRASNRIKICNGCKGSLSDEHYVVRHCCRMPYYKRSLSGTLEKKLPPRPQAHHFHINARCIKRTHEQFNQRVTIEGSVSCTVVRQKCAKAGFTFTTRMP